MLATQDADGTPHLAPVMFLFDGERIVIETTARTEPADGLRPGLDHVAFNCPDRAALEQWAERLDELGIPRGPIVDATYG